MDTELLHNLLKGNTSVNVGPIAKELLLDKVAYEYNNNNSLASIFYQVRSLYQTTQERFYRMDKMANVREKTSTSAPEIEAKMNSWEMQDIENNPLLAFAVSTIKKSKVAIEQKKLNDIDTCNFLRNIVEPMEGIKKIEQIMQEFPKEWTIMQLCKGPRADTTYSIYPHIHEHDAAIYLTLLRHARSENYPTPICLRFGGPEQMKLFKKFASIANRFKQCISIDVKTWNTKESKQFYWKILDALNQYIAAALDDLKNFFYPWNFLFTGRPHAISKELITAQEKRTFEKVDEFCDYYKWTNNERVLFSLAVLHVDTLTDLEKHAICNALTKVEKEQEAAFKLLAKFTNEVPKEPKTPAATKTTTKKTKVKSVIKSKHYPVMLVVDERLDHFFWEELNVQQEFCRVASVQTLWYLFQTYKQRIRNGYLMVNINDGGCLINPDGNLPKSEMRMRSFFEYWTPHWQMSFQKKPTQDELLNEFLKRSCYVYAGHGSGLQYINGKHIAKGNLNCVVFLFGCDSTRLHSNGLYSELIGSHSYYQAANCPTLVGTLMPGLDSFMDNIATEILSRWIAPNSKDITPWHQIDNASWIKEGKVKPKITTAATTSMTTTANNSQKQKQQQQQQYQQKLHHHNGSLCAILTRVHQRVNDMKLYNTVAYVCRGLPAWNCDVETLPT